MSKIFTAYFCIFFETELWLDEKSLASLVAHEWFHGFQKPDQKGQIKNTLENYLTDTDLKKWRTS